MFSLTMIILVVTTGIEIFSILIKLAIILALWRMMLLFVIICLASIIIVITVLCCWLYFSISSYVLFFLFYFLNLFILIIIILWFCFVVCAVWVGVVGRCCKVLAEGQGEGYSGFGVLVLRLTGIWLCGVFSRLGVYDSGFW